MLDGPPDALAALARSGLATLDDFFEEAVDQAVIYRRGESRSVARLEIPGLGTVYAKRWRRTRVWTPSFLSDGQGRGLRVERDDLARMTSWGLSVPRVVAFAEARKGLGLSRALLVTAQIPGVQIHHYLEGHPEARPEVLRRLGAYFRTLRVNGVWHASPSVVHIYVDAGPLVSMIDVALPRHRQRDLERTELVLRDLGVGQEESEAFWSACLGADALGAAERQLLQRVRDGAELRERKREARRRRGRRSQSSG